MKHVSLIFSLAVLCALCGCATTAKYEALLDTYMGKNEQHLLDGFGVPSQTYESESRKYLVYERSRLVYFSGIEPMYQTFVHHGRRYYRPFGGMAPSWRHYHCTTTFALQDDKIVRWQHRGNNCVSDYEPPESGRVAPAVPETKGPEGEMPQGRGAENKKPAEKSVRQVLD